MFARRHGIYLALLTLLTSAGVVRAEAGTDAPAPPLWEQLLWWLPENTETVIVAQEPFELPKPGTEELKFDEAVRLLPAGPPMHLQQRNPSQGVAREKTPLRRRRQPPLHFAGRPGVDDVRGQPHPAVRSRG